MIGVELSFCQGIRQLRTLQYDTFKSSIKLYSNYHAKSDR